MASQPRYLTGQVVAITGGARGIGRATAQACIREGMRVVIGDLDIDTAERTAKELGAGTVALPLNVTERASVRAFIEAAEEQVGPVDVLINNAGIMQLGPFVDEDDATAQRQIDINVNGVLYGMKEILPRFLSRNRGHLINVASVAGKGGFPGGVTYCGTKHFVVGVSEGIRAELRESQVDISVVMPSIVNTELSAGTSKARFVKNVEADDVAAEIVDALKQPRFEIFVPKMLASVARLTAMLPRSMGEGIARVLKADQVLSQIDNTQRKSYELRASKSEPGLEPGDEQVQLTPGAS